MFTPHKLYITMVTNHTAVTAFTVVKPTDMIFMACTEKSGYSQLNLQQKTTKIRQMTKDKIDLLRR